MNGATTRTTPGLAERCRAAIEMLEESLKRPPLELWKEVDHAEQQVAELRDALIERLRHDPFGPTAERQRAALQRVNAALSLVVGVEYPTAGVHRPALEQARDALRGVLTDGPE